MLSYILLGNQVRKAVNSRLDVRSHLAQNPGKLFLALCSPKPSKFRKGAQQFNL
jgi:hypothetical protein